MQPETFKIHRLFFDLPKDLKPEQKLDLLIASLTPEQKVELLQNLEGENKD